MKIETPDAPAAAPSGLRRGLRRRTLLSAPLPHTEYAPDGPTVLSFDAFLASTAVAAPEAAPTSAPDQAVGAPE